MSNPLEEYCEKRAFFGGKAKSIAKGLGEGVADAFTAKGIGTLGTQAAVVAGAGMLIDSARKTYMAATKNQHFKKMLDVNPDLGEAQQQDPKMFNQHYNSLRNLNPQFAADPVVAGAYMRQMSEFPQNAGKVLVEAMQTRSAPGGGLKDFSTGLGIAQKAAPPSEMDQMRLEQMRAGSE